MTMTNKSGCTIARFNDLTKIKDRLHDLSIARFNKIKSDCTIARFNDLTENIQS